MLIAAARSACGATHVRNDDRIVVGPTVLTGAEEPGTAAALTWSTPDVPYVACVFDGVGGSVRGDLAALSGAQALAASASSDAPLAQRLSSCVAAVLSGQENLADHERAYTVGAGIMLESTPSESPHAPTLACTVFHMGDCRVYRMRQGFLTLLTRDHSVAQRYHDEIGPDAQVPANLAHVVTSYAGGDIEDPFESGPASPVMENDIFLCCSDGFWEHAGIEETETTLAAALAILSHHEGPLTLDDLQDSLDEAAGELVAAAQANGSPDDISVALTWNAPVALAHELTLAQNPGSAASVAETEA